MQTTDWLYIYSMPNTIARDHELFTLIILNRIDGFHNIFSRWQLEGKGSCDDHMTSKSRNCLFGGRISVVGTMLARALYL